MNNTFISTKEAATILGIDPRTVQRHARIGYFPSDVCGRTGRKYLFNKDNLIKFIFSDRLGAA